MKIYQSAAVLFDLDGVLTDTAVIHERAWAGMFGEFFDQQPTGTGLSAYTAADYFAHIDGRPRYDGVRAVLAARGLQLPEGDADDPPDSRSVTGLGNRKNAILEQLLRDEGVRAYPGSVALVEWLVARAMPLAVVSSSANAPSVLDAAGLLRHFPIIVDGVVAARAGLAGKPDPATYLHAAHLLGVAPADTVVVEDAVSGVRAGRAGGFRVIGVDRGAGRDELRDNGADVVVDDLAELVATDVG